MLLVAVDLEGCAPEVMNVAGKLASELGCDLTVATALMVPPNLPANTKLPGTEQTVHDQVRGQAEAALHDLGAGARALGVNTHTYVQFGPPQAVVLEAVSKLNPRFLVLGTHARTGVSRWVFGSVEETITRRCPIPVLVVPAHDHAKHPHPALEALRTESEG